ncbi:MAG TPA: hypothetical protein PKA41_19695, partial [Verrucomicrobiota bacterium]|nr:hypothetical protein [Verrucomicrobiota bacterium]
RALPVGYSLVANPLDHTSPSGNTITNLFASGMSYVQGGNVMISRWTGSGFQTLIYWGGTSIWTDELSNPVTGVTLEVGEGVLVLNNSVSVTNTFVGDVAGFDFDLIQRLPVPSVPAGIYLRGSVAPLQPSGFADIMGRAPVDYDAVMKLDAGGNSLVSYFLAGQWHDPFGGNLVPTVNVGEAAFFDTTGGMFGSFALPSVPLVPEPATATILLLGTLAVIRLRRQGSALS